MSEYEEIVVLFDNGQQAAFQVPKDAEIFRPQTDSEFHTFTDALQRWVKSEEADRGVICVVHRGGLVLMARRILAVAIRQTKGVPLSDVLKQELPL